VLWARGQNQSAAGPQARQPTARGGRRLRMRSLGAQGLGCCGPARPTAPDWWARQGSRFIIRTAALTGRRPPGRNGPSQGGGGGSCNHSEQPKQLHAA